MPAKYVCPYSKRPAEVRDRMRLDGVRSFRRTRKLVAQWSVEAFPLMSPFYLSPLGERGPIGVLVGPRLASPSALVSARAKLAFSAGLKKAAWRRGAHVRLGTAVRC